MVVALKTITDIDPSVNQLYDMPTRMYGEREAIGKDWVFYKY